jgi:hypothetical protein
MRRGCEFGRAVALWRVGRGGSVGAVSLVVFEIIGA